MNTHDIIFAYAAIGILWAGLGILTGYLKVRTENPLLALLTLAVAWPYFAYRIIRNILSGDPNGDIW